MPLLSCVALAALLCWLALPEHGAELLAGVELCDQAATLKTSVPIIDACSLFIATIRCLISGCDRLQQGVVRRRAQAPPALLIRLLCPDRRIQATNNSVDQFAESIRKLRGIDNFLVSNGIRCRDRRLHKVERGTFLVSPVLGPEQAFHAGHHGGSQRDALQQFSEKIHLIAPYL